MGPSTEKAPRGIPDVTKNQPATLPAGFADMVPGPDLVAALDTVDMQVLTGAELATVLAAYEQVAAWAYEGTARAAAEVSHRVARDSCRAGRRDYGQGRFSAATHEVALAMGSSRGSARRLVTQGWALATTLGEVALALRAGDLPAGHGKVLADRLAAETPELCAAVLEAVLPGARELTPRTLGIAVDTAVHLVDPGRHLVDQRARQGRRVGAPCPLGQGMASLTAVLPSVDAARVDRVLEHVARGARTAGDVRSIGELRADIMVDVLTGTTSTTPDRATTTRTRVTAPQRAMSTGTATPTAATAATGAHSAAAPQTPSAATTVTGVGPWTSHTTTRTGPARANTSTTQTTTANPATTRAWTDPDAEATTPDRTYKTDPDLDADPDTDLDDPWHPPWRLPPPGSVHVQVTISAASLLGLTDEPAHIPGAGTIDAVTARALAHDNPWRRIVTDPLTGAITDVGRTRYRPPPALAAHVAARDPHCVCGTCTQPTHQCDTDHVHEWRHGGTTSTTNLAPLCRASHTLKTDGRLTLTITGPGQYQWTTPLGNTYHIDTNTGLPRRKPTPGTPPF